jgi:spore coat-associated protein N
MMFKHWKILATVASIGVASVAAIGGTYANFTATPTSISNNAFTSGSLTMSRSGSGAVFSASPAKIGDEATGSVTITNTGNLAGVYTLSGSMSGSSALGDQLNMKIYNDNDGQAGSKIYDGALSAFSTAGLGTFTASGGAHTYYFHVSLPTTGTDAGDNALQGLSSSETLTWSATQA